jgi:hypothetical protein
MLHHTEGHEVDKDDGIGDALITKSGLTVLFHVECIKWQLYSITIKEGGLVDVYHRVVYCDRQGSWHCCGGHMAGPAINLVQVFRT